MYVIHSKELLAPRIYELVIEAPRVARKARPGQFVVVMNDEKSERIPLTIADFDRDSETITLVVMEVGASTRQICGRSEGETLYALIGPLGEPSHIEDHGTVIMVAGGVGAAPVFPIARAYRQTGQRVITIQGARTRELLFWTHRLSSVSDEHIITTDDGSEGQKGLVTEPLAAWLNDHPNQVGCVYAIGPAVMMKFCSLATRPFGIKTVVSLNPVMVDGTGMCGGCRVELGDEVKFTCVDGPEFDGHLVDWETLLARQRLYAEHEKCALQALSHEAE